MNTDALLSPIRDEPEDDLVRLAFADACEERGDDARAEFIRVQVELARLPTTSPRVPELRLREGDLLLAHEREWPGEWEDRLVHWEFRRGFLDRAKLLPGPFVRQGDGKSLKAGPGA